MTSTCRHHLQRTTKLDMVVFYKNILSLEDAEKTKPKVPFLKKKHKRAYKDKPKGMLNNECSQINIINIFEILSNWISKVHL